MTDPILPIVGIDLRELVRPSTDDIPEERRPDYLRRSGAVIDVAGGTPVTVAARLHGVDPRTVTRDCEIAMELAIDGLRIGFRACIPFKHRRAKPRPADMYVEAPPTKGPYAFQRLLQGCEKARKIIEAYKGALPDGKRKARAFDRLFDQFKAIIRATLGKEGYPFTAKDEGRRALLLHIKRIRQARQEAGAAETEDTEPNVTRFNQIFHLAPLDRIEFDAHKIDIDWVLNLTDPQGRLVQRHIECITVLVAICVVSRYVLAHLLVLGAYNHLDVLRLFHKALSPWQRRTLIVPGMQYPEGAQLGLPINEQGAGPRGILIAGDNALAHHAHHCVSNLLDHHRGFLNFGPSHVPEVRPIVEAFFRLLEEGALRKLAGAFQPESRTRGKTRTSYVRAEDHPFHYEGMEDLMDVLMAGYNITPHSGLGGRTPASAVNTHLASGWSWYSSDAASDASRLTTIRFAPTIRGGASGGRPPFVQYYGVHYRSSKLMGRRDMVGKRLFAEANLQDLRQIVLLSPDDGAPWSRLTARSPWDRTPHDLHLRQQIIRARNRGLLDLKGSSDAVESYHAFTHELALQDKAAPDLYARVDAHFQPTPSPALAASTPPVVLPRRGRTTFAHRKD